MKFGKKLRFECVSEWSNKYLSYGKLKKYLRYLYRSDLKKIGEAEEAHLLINGFPAITQQPLPSPSPSTQLPTSASGSSSPTNGGSLEGSINSDIIIVPIQQQPQQQPLQQQQQQQQQTVLQPIQTPTPPPPPSSSTQPSSSSQASGTTGSTTGSTTATTAQLSTTTTITAVPDVPQQSPPYQPPQITTTSSKPTTTTTTTTTNDNNNNNNNNNNSLEQQLAQAFIDNKNKSINSGYENDETFEDDNISVGSRKSSLINSEKTPLISVLDHNGKQVTAPPTTPSKQSKRKRQEGPPPMPIFSQEERERLFLGKIDDEIKKINHFFTTIEKDIILHYNKLTEHCSLILKDRNPSPKVLKNIQKAFGELYKGLTMLENYVALNYQGFEKILKKYDRLAPMGCSIKSEQMQRIQHEKFHSSKTWRNMKEDTELLYCKIFKLDKIAIAKKKLQPFSESQSTDYHMLKLGFAIGVSISILTFVIILFTNQSLNPNPDWTRFISTIPIFRAVGIPILAVWLWGVNVYIWDRARVNYILIFGLDPRTSIDHRRIWKTASFLTAIWLTTFLLFCGTVTGNFKLGNVPAQVYPLVLVVFFLCVVFFPFRFFHRKSRSVLFITLGNVLITPFGSTKFRALFIGDVLTSMVKTIFDIEYTACYFFSGDWMINDGTRCNQVNAIALPILSGLPLLWRFMQCILRYRETKNRIHLGNSTKYAVGFSVVLFSALNGNYQSYEPWSASRILWCVCFVLSTLYMYCWDVVVDWGFMWLGSPRPLLRHQLMYKKHIVSYYYVLFSNLVFRFAWTLTITKIPFDLPINNELFVSIIASIEIIRRFTWSIFRVENEHICNSIQYHAFDFSEAPWKNEVPKIESPKTLLPLSSAYPFGHIDNNNNNSGSFTNSTSTSNYLNVTNNNNSGSGSGSGGGGSNNISSPYSYHDNQYSIWKKSSKQYYSTSLIDSLKNKFFNKNNNNK